MEFLFAHTRIGFCWWDLLALLILIAVIVVFIVKINKRKKNPKPVPTTPSCVMESSGRKSKARYNCYQTP